MSKAGEWDAVATLLGKIEQNDWQAMIATLAAVPDAAADQELCGLLAHARAKQKAATEAAERERREHAEHQRRKQAERKRAREEQAERERQADRQISGPAVLAFHASGAQDPLLALFDQVLATFQIAQQRHLFLPPALR